MAIRTISAAGGNWNATTTWVEGIVPTSADTIVGNATSGSVTINVAGNCANFNLVNYNGTFSFSGNALISQGSAAGLNVSTFSSTFKTVGGSLSNAMRFSTNHTIIANNAQFAYFRCITNNVTINFNDTLIINNGVDLGSSAIMNGGTFSFRGTTFETGTTLGPTSSTTIYEFKPTAGTQTWSLQNPFYFRNHKVVLDGTVFPIAPTFPIRFQAGNIIGQQPHLIYAGGTISAMSSSTVQPNLPGIYIETNAAGANYVTIETGGLTISNVHLNLQMNFGHLNPLEIRLNSDMIFNNMTLQPTLSVTSTQSVVFSGSGRMIGGNLRAVPISFSSPTLNGYISRTIVPNIRLHSGPTHSLTTLQANSLLAASSDAEISQQIFRLSSFTASQEANLAITSTHSITDAVITDINASLGNPVQTLRTTLSGTTNITNYNSFSGGGGGGSFTFID